MVTRPSVHEVTCLVVMQSRSHNHLRKSAGSLGQVVPAME